MKGAETERLGQLSDRAWRRFGGDAADYMRVEALYHRFTADPEGAAIECGIFYDYCDNRGRYGTLLALGFVLAELLGRERVDLPGGLPAALNVLATIRYYYPRLDDRLETVLELARAALPEALSSGVKWLIGDCYDRIGDVLRDQEHFAAALDCYRSGLEVAERYAREEPSKPDRRHGVAISHQRIGEMLEQANDPANAIQHYRAELEIAEGLVVQEPDNPDWQDDVATAHESIGNLQLAVGNVTDALASLTASLDIRARLATRDPDGAASQRELAVSYEHVGKALMAKQDFSDALNAFRAGLTIAERLAHLDPTNADWQVDLSISFGTVAEALLEAAEARDKCSDWYAEARTLIARGIEILDDLIQNRPATPQEQHAREWLKELESGLPVS